MYRDFYKLSNEPFRVTPDPEFLFLTHQYKEALAAIVYGIAERKGFICITGEVGVGKTTILRSYLSGIDRDNIRFVYIFSPNVSFGVLLKSILRDLGVTEIGDHVPDMVEALHRFLLEAYELGINVVLFVDEAQNMPVETLENLRMLSNLETETHKLLQIVLVGQPELEQLLATRELRQLRSRMAVRAKIGPLAFRESIAYIRHRIGRVALDDKPAFTEAAMALVARQARGIPRAINILCDNALMTGYGYSQRPVSARIVREVIADTGEKVQGAWHRRAGFGAAAAMLVLLIAGGAWTWREGRAPMMPPEVTQAFAKLPAWLQGTDQPTAEVEVALTPAAVETRGTLALAPARLPAASPAPPPKPAAPLPVAVGPVGVDEAAVSTVPPGSGEPRPRPTARPAKSPPGGETQPLQRVVQRGDTLSGLMLEIYGVYDKSHLDWVRIHNPELADVNRLEVGQVLEFPRLGPTEWN